MNKRITRRRLLQLMVAALGGAGALWLKLAAGRPVHTTITQISDSEAHLLLNLKPEAPTATPTATQTIAQASDPEEFLPLVLKPEAPTATPTATPTRTPLPPTSSRVVHVHASTATSWNFSTGWYGDPQYVSQTVVNNMTDEGLKRLTGQSTVSGAWGVLLPGYIAGRATAIKVNFNNAWQGCADSDNVIDGLIYPVNALIRGMVGMGVRQADIWVYDASRPLPNRFRGGCLYPSVRFFDNSCAESATFNSSDPQATVAFQQPALTPRRLADVVINAAYLINMPIIKDHAGAGATLAFKNHFGTIDGVDKGGSNNLHNYLGATSDPSVAIYKNPHISGKTVLTVGDGLYGSLNSNMSVPQRWSSFGNQAPNSLLFAKDPVAIDCVMLDILDGEPVYHPPRDAPNAYLQQAAQSGLGVYERGNLGGGGYTKIDYQRIEL